MSLAHQNAEHTAEGMYYLSRWVYSSAPGDVAYFKARAMMHGVCAKGCPPEKAELLKAIIDRQSGNPHLKTILERLQ